MKAPQKKSINSSSISLPARIFHGIAFSGLTVTMFFAIFANGLVIPFGLLVSAMSVTLLLLAMPVYDKIIKGQTQSKFNTWAAWIISTLIYLLAIVLLSGLLQDIMQVNCTGLFGTTQSCLSVKLFELYITALNPYLYLTVTGIIVCLLIRSRTNKIR